MKTVPYWPLSRFEHMKPKEIEKRDARFIQMNFGIAHAKRDGHCLYIHRDTEQVRAVTRTPRRVSFKEGRYAWWDNLINNLPNNSELMAEIWCEGYPCTNVSSALAGHEPYASALRLDVFSVIHWDGVPALHWNETNAVNGDKALSFEEAENLVKSIGLSYAPWIDTYSESFNPNNIMDNSEGWVYKTTQNQWPKQPRTWAKQKGKRNIDLRCVGFTEGRGKYAGKVGSILLESDDGKTRAQCSGMDDETRNHMTEWPDWWMGRIIEVEYEVRTPDGNLRHPQYKRWRDDKSIT